MNALERYLTDQVIDLSGFDTSAMDAIDSAVAPRSVCKYFGSSRREFFAEPTVRFTQKSALNDPFELAPRWKETTSDSTRQLFARNIKGRFSRLVPNEGLILEIARQSFAKQGVFVTPDQMAAAACYLLSYSGGKHFESVIENTISSIDTLVDIAMPSMTADFDAEVNQMGVELGILSLSEVPNSHQMWALYSSSGQGFVVEFDSKHDFFQFSGRSLLRKVVYSDDLFPDLWHNPFSLFLTKCFQWSFEREWRMIKRLNECEIVKDVQKDKVYLCRVKPGMIKSVTFGYKYDVESIPRDGALIRSFDREISINVARINSRTRDIELQQLH